jgi:OmpA-OmpF porin, OOP family
LLFSNAKEESRNLDFGKSVGSGYFPKDFSADFPGDRDHFDGKWHHAAMIKKGNQIKCYLDQFRVLVIPDCVSCEVTTVEAGGIGDAQHPIVFKNFRIAAGGNMNMIGKKFTDSKIVTHGINFDTDKATIKPESMGTLNMIVRVLKDNPDIKFEIDGHTDNSGTAPHNLTLSQQRADAVKTQLVTMGVDASRLTTRGLGDTKPIADNTTPDGKANNRRVEFVKM